MKALVYKHFEKLLLLLGVAYLVWALVAGWGAQPIDDQEGEYDMDIERVEGWMTSGSAPDVSGVPYYESLKQYRNDIETGRAFYQWAGEVRPEFPPAKDGGGRGPVLPPGPKPPGPGNPTPPIKVPIYAAVDIKQKIEMGFVTITWRNNPKNKLILDGYRIYRRKVGAPWPVEPLNETLITRGNAHPAAARPNVIGGPMGLDPMGMGLDGGFGARFNKKKPKAKKRNVVKKVVKSESSKPPYEYVDLQVVPKVDYEYRIVGIKGIKLLNTPEPIAALTEGSLEKNKSFKVSVPRAIKLYYTGGTSMQVTLTVQRFIRQKNIIDGQSIVVPTHKRFFVKKGGPIGGKKAVKIDGEKVWVDFTSGYLLKDVVSKKETVAVKIKVPGVDKDGAPIMVEKEVTRIKKRNYIIVEEIDTKKTTQIERITPQKLNKILGKLKGPKKAKAPQSNLNFPGGF